MPLSVKIKIFWLSFLCLFLTACPTPTDLDLDTMGGAGAGQTSDEMAGDRAEDVAGDDAGDVAGDVAGDTAGDVAGDYAGDVAGDIAGDPAGDTAGDDAGETAGDMAGDIAGAVAGEINPSCAVPLSFPYDRLAVLPLSLTRLEVSGGSGDLFFTLIESTSGGLINEDTGSYLAGTISGVIDVIEVVDQTCDQTLSISIEVVNPTQLLPSQPSVPRGQTVEFELTEGSGEHEFSWVFNASGGELTERGLYQAGDTLGEDRIQVRDLRTREEILVIINVVTRVSITVEPSLSWIPVGSTHTLQVTGGSGVYDYEWQPLRRGDRTPELSPSSGQLIFEAQGQGEGVLVIRDRFLDVEAQTTIQQLSSLNYSGVRSGKDQRESNMLAWPDQDGDGINELVFATGEPNLDSAAETGAVYIYSSSTREVTQRLTRPERVSRFGRQVAVGDWNHDGLSDLIVSAHLADRGTSGDVGAVYIYEGLMGGTVDPEPRFILQGPRGGGQMGTGIALCDFNGDGWSDLALGAWISEIPGQGANDQGVIYIYLGSEAGFVDEPDQSIGGRSLAEGEGESAWSPRGSHRMGYELEAGDFDGDGRCDLAASSYTTRGTLNVANTGEVHVYRGVDTLDDSIPRAIDGGVSPLPVVAITAAAGDGNGARLGRRLLAFDREGDGRAELLVSQTRNDIGSNDSGSVYLYAWEMLPSEPASGYITTEDAQEVFRGTSGSELFGYGLAVGDFDGDQKLDLAIGGYNGEVSGGQSNAGKLNLFLYDEASGAYETTPSYVMSGINNGDNLGESVAILGPGHVASFAFGVDELGPNVGMPYWGTLVDDPELEGGQTIELYPLAYEGNFGHGRFGIDFDLTDRDDNGVLDVIAGASYIATEAVSTTRVGAGFIYQIDDVNAPDTLDGGPRTPIQSLQGFRGHSGYDHLGEGASFIGDFDGDGQGDVALVARFEERPNSFGNQDLVDVRGCPPRRNNSGAVYIFRGLDNGGYEDDPSFVIYGKSVNENIERVGGEVDMNNDQRADLLMGARFLDVGGVGNDAGRAAVFLGRPAPADGRRLVICEADAEMIGERGGTRLGTSLSPLGDLNGDGCDEAIFGQPDMRVETRNRQGAVHIIYGWGSAGCFDAPRVLSLTATDAEGRFGQSVAGADLDLDGQSEIIAGAYNGRSGNIRPGVVWIARGSAIQGLSPIGLDEPKVYHDVSTWIDTEQAWRLEGNANIQRYGLSVAAITGYLLVGIPRQGDAPGAFHGGAHLYRFGENGLEGLAGVMVGETSTGYSELGNVVKLHRTDDQAWIGVGSLWGIGTHDQGGSVYVGSFTP